MFRRFGKRNQSDAPNTPTTSAAGSRQNDEHARILARVPLFLDLGKRELQRISAGTTLRDYPAGAKLVEQGSPGVGLFVVVSGRVRISQHPDGGGDEHELAVVGPDEALGEMALLDELPRSATATALEPTRALLLPFQDFRAALREDPDISIKLLSVMSRRLRRAETRAY
ncbi:MAG TPA: Crp/Fnr family transcriptional regulator [Ktedonobacterales bacterium]|nr:Crp/Fnr family transcriptional regulator [Ktedonobacterales bacterium]